MRNYARLLLLFTCAAAPASAQIPGTVEPADTAQIAPTDNSIDTAYLTDLYDRFTVRLYGSNKYTRYTIGGYDSRAGVRYHPNTNYNVGVGFNYRFLAINIGVKTPGINNDNDERGKTKFFDLQAYVYGRKFNIDIYGQTHKGYYVAKTADVFGQREPQPFTLRPDVHTRIAGVTAERIFNPKRYSFRAVFLQNEYQKKSAGSFLAGAGIRYQHVRADGPLGFPDPFISHPVVPVIGYNRATVASIGVHGGYAHTFVLSRHVFLMAQLTVGAGGQYTQLSEVQGGQPAYDVSNFSYSLTGIGRTGIGYQGSEWFAGAYFVSSLWHDKTPLSDTWQQYETGVLRIAVARHFELREKTVKSLGRFEPRPLRRRG